MLFANKLDVDQAEACTTIMTLGNQFCLKNDSFARSMNPDRLITLDKILSRYFVYYGERAQKSFDELLQKTVNTPPNPQRLFSEVMKAKYGG